MSGTSSNARYGKTRKGFGKQGGGDFKGYVDIHLSATDKEEVQELAAGDTVDLVAFIEALSEDGYKFSLAADFEHSVCIATAIGKAKTNENFGYALSGRGPTPRDAIVVLWYKVAQMTNWGTWLAEGGEDSTQLPLWS